MSDNRKKLQAIRNQIKENSLKLEFSIIHAEFAEWLEQLKLPAGFEGENWGKSIIKFPELSEEELETTDSSLSLRLALKLYTTQNKYVISIMECLGEGANGVGIVTVFVNWDEIEKIQQRKIEESYNHKFDDVLKAKHTIWAQTFRGDEFVDALRSCALSILSHELRAIPPSPSASNSFKVSHTTMVNLPKQVKDEIE